MKIKELFEGIGFEYTGEVNAINFGYPCYKMQKGSFELIICESLNQIGFDYMFGRMVQPVGVTYNFFKNRM